MNNRFKKWFGIMGGLMISFVMIHSLHAENRSSPKAAILIQGPGQEQKSGIEKSLHKQLSSLGVGVVSVKTASGGDSAMWMAEAQKQGASLALLLEFETQETGVVRSTKMTGHKAQVKLRLVDFSDNQTVFNKSATGFGFDTQSASAMKDAVGRAFSKSRQGLVPAVLKHWPMASQAKGTTFSVTIVGANRLRPIGMVLRKLAASRGLAYMHVMSWNGTKARLVIASTQTLSGLVAHMRKTKIVDGMLSVQASGRSLQILIGGIPRG